MTSVAAEGGGGGTLTTPTTTTTTEATTPDKEDLDPIDKNTWKCPDPGCKKANEKSATSCAQCNLPKNSAHQFKREGGRNGGQKRGRGGGKHHGKSRPLPEGLDANNPVVQMFQQHSKILDHRHDKHERIVKLSRDITIESKRIIFLLHRIKSEEDLPDVLLNSENKFNDIRRNYWYYVAKELENEDPFQFLRAYTNGLQEYIEAVSFYNYICFKKLITWDEIQDKLTFRKKKNDKEEDLDGGQEPKVAAESNQLKVYVPKTDFILGLADLTGELMRQAINSVGVGDMNSCFELCEFLHEIHNGFLIISGSGYSSRELRKKMQTLVQSLKKVETACYTINVRGSEVPKHLLAEYFNKNDGNVEIVDSSSYFDD